MEAAEATDTPATITEPPIRARSLTQSETAMKPTRSQAFGWIGAAVVLLTALDSVGCRSYGERGGRARSPVAVADPPGNAAGAPGPGMSGQVLPGAPASALPIPVASKPYGGQKTCPVMGDDLGAMGTPIPVTVKGQTIYVCCRGCVAKVQRDPDTHLAKVAAERAKS